MPRLLPLLTLLLTIAGPATSPTARAATGEPGTAAMQAARTFVAEATRQHGATVDIKVHAPGSPLPPCDRHEIFLPAESRLWGKTRVGVKCDQPAPWTAFLAVTVSVKGTYLLSAKKINRGQTLTASDFVVVAGELTSLPDSTLTDPRLALGQRAKVSLAAQQPLRRDHLYQPPVVKQGDKVRLVARGHGFSASTEGTALNNAAAGEPVKVRTAGGQTLSGVAQKPGEVALPQ